MGIHCWWIELLTFYKFRKTTHPKYRWLFDPIWPDFCEIVFWDFVLFCFSFIVIVLFLCSIVYLDTNLILLPRRWDIYVISATGLQINPVR
jgi:uncharacterized membrane protein